MRLWQLHTDHCHQSFTNIVAGQILFHIFEEAHLLACVIDGPCKRGTEAGEMRSAVHGIDVVGETEYRLGISVVVLQSDLHHHAVTVGFHVNRLIVQNLLATIEVLDEFGNPTVVLELGSLRLAGLGIGGALVSESDEQALVEERQLSQTLRQSVKVKFGGGEDTLVGQEVNFGSAFFGGASLLELAGGFTLGVSLFPGETVTPDFKIEFFTECVHHRNAHAVQSAGDFVRRRIKLAAGVQLGHHHFGCRHLFAVHFHRVHGNAATVVDHGDRVVDVNSGFNLVGITGKRFVHGVVYNFVNQMMQSQFTGRTDVHRGTLAHGFHPAQHLDGIGGIVSVACDDGRPLVFCFSFCDGSCAQCLFRSHSSP